MNSFDDLPNGLGDRVCLSVRVVIPADGILKVDAVPTSGAKLPVVEVETVGVPCCGDGGNPVSFPVKAGTEVVVNVEAAFGSAATASQSFTVNTSIAPQ